MPSRPWAPLFCAAISGMGGHLFSRWLPHGPKMAAMALWYQNLILGLMEKEWQRGMPARSVLYIRKARVFLEAPPGRVLLVSNQLEPSLQPFLSQLLIKRITWPLDKSGFIPRAQEGAYLL